MQNLDFGLKLQIVITALVAVAVVWVGLQTGDWTGLVLVVPLALIIPITARLPKDPPRRRRRNGEDSEPRRY